MHKVWNRIVIEKNRKLKEKINIDSDLKSGVKGIGARVKIRLS